MAVPDLQAAITHLQQKNVDAAITELEAKIDELPAHLTAHVLLARAYEAQRRWDEALKCWENVRFLMPNSPVARDGKARIRRRLNQAEPTGAASADRPSPDRNGTAPAQPPAGTEADDATDAEAPSSDAAAPDTDASDAESPDDMPSDDDVTDDDAPDEDPADPTPTDEADSEAPPSPPEDDEAAPPPSGDADAAAPDPAGPTTAAEAVSELEQLRQQAEEEARRGGARGNMSEPSRSADDDTPEGRVGQLEDNDDLDRLIDELESARIEPSPNMEEVPEPDLEDDVDDIVSETLARIHEAQDQYRKAAQIYVKLASQEPDQARAYLKKASEMRERAEAQEEAEARDEAEEENAQ